MTRQVCASVPRNAVTAAGTARGRRGISLNSFQKPHAATPKSIRGKTETQGLTKNGFSSAPAGFMAA